MEIFSTFSIACGYLLEFRVTESMKFVKYHETEELKNEIRGRKKIDDATSIRHNYMSSCGHGDATDAHFLIISGHFH